MIQQYIWASLNSNKIMHFKVSNTETLLQNQMQLISIKIKVLIMQYDTKRDIFVLK